MNTDILRRWHERGESERILTALEKTPAQQPKALFYAAAALIDLGREDEAEKQLEKALLLTKEDNLRADLLALRSFIHARQDDLLGYVAGAEQAARLKHTPLTLYHLGLASTDPEKGLEALHTALKSAEMVRDEYASTRNAFALAVPLLRLGRYQEALHWLRYSELRCHHNGLRMALLYTRACVQIFLGEVDGLADELRGALDQYGSSHPWIQEPLSTALADLFQVEERYEEALAIYQRWLIESPRSGWIRLTHGAVRALTKLQRLEEAQRLAQTASVVADDVMTYRADAQLVVGLSLWPRREAETHLLSAYRAFEGKIVPRATEAALHLTALYQLQGKHAEAHHIFAQSQPSLKELGVTGLKLLGGRALDLLELPFDARSVPHAFLLGRRDVLEAG